MSPVLAIDVGGTNVRLAVIDEAGSILREGRQRVDLSRQQHATTDAAETYIIDTLATAIRPVLAQQQVTGIGIGFPGFIRGDTGILAASPNLPGLTEFPLAERLAASLGMPVAVQNDALCAAIGEHRFGAGRGHAHLLHLTLGTGVGGGLIVDNRPWSGEGGMAMEIGHLTLDRSDAALPCGCGNRGCLETIASATAVRRRYEQLAGRAMEPDQIYQLAVQGDAKGRQAISEAGTALGLTIAEAAKLLDIHLVTISGGLTGAWSLLHPAMQQAMEPNLIPPLRGKIGIVRSLLGDNAGILGAAAIVLGT